MSLRALFNSDLYWTGLQDDPPSGSCGESPSLDRTCPQDVSSESVLRICPQNDLRTCPRPMSSAHAEPMSSVHVFSPCPQPMSSAHVLTPHVLGPCPLGPCPQPASSTLLSEICSTLSNLSFSPYSSSLFLRFGASLISVSSYFLFYQSPFLCHNCSIKSYFSVFLLYYFII